MKYTQRTSTIKESLYVALIRHVLTQTLEGFLAANILSL